MTTRAATLYFDETQGLLHRLTSNVEPSGAHQVTGSDIISCNRIAFETTLRVARCVYGEANVRAYIVTEVKS